MWNGSVEPTHDADDAGLEGGSAGHDASRERVEPAPQDASEAGAAAKDLGGDGDAMSDGRGPDDDGASGHGPVGDEASGHGPVGDATPERPGGHATDASPDRHQPVPDDGPVGPGEVDADAMAAEPGRSALADTGSKRGRRRRRGPRPHPFAHETSSVAETRLHAGSITWLWLGGATLAMVAGLLLSRRFSRYGGQGPPAMEYIVSVMANFLLIGHAESPTWEQWTLIPLFAGLALLGFGFVRQSWSKRLTMAGWLLFGFYWGLTATDLYASEDQDIVNYIFALVGVYFFAYLAYQQWLDLMRGSDTHALHFLNVTAFVAAGTYFVIAKITFLRVWLINVVGAHTKWMLDLFGQGDKANLQFVVDKQDSQGPVTFFYPDYYCEGNRGDMVGEYCRQAGAEARTYFPEASGLWEKVIYYNADADGVVPVSIILACTAIQSIMLFVGLFAATKAPLRKKVYASIIVGAIIYVLNLVRNTGIIWMFGQGHASFWLMHNAIGKGGSLIAMIGIAFAVFKWFPEFFDSLVQVLDLPDRDGPIERTLRIGRRRPGAAAVLEPAA